jgi:uncharacterized protein (DUF3084 family)
LEIKGTIMATKLTMALAKIDALAATIAALEDQLVKTRADESFLRERLNAVASEHRCGMDSERKETEKARKEREAVLAENVTLRENLQRALGYIDKANEMLPSLDQVMTCPPQYSQPQRGPQLHPVGITNTHTAYELAQRYR